MFERNRSTVETGQLLSVEVELELDDGALLRGKVRLSTTKGFAEALNGPATFLEFVPQGEERLYLSKSAIRSIKPIHVPGAEGLASRQPSSGGFDPFQVLGVTRETPWEDIRGAYHRLSKAYHPDRFQSVELPGEVRDYLAQMTRRLNAAFAALERVAKAERSTGPSRREPDRQSHRPG